MARAVALRAKPGGLYEKEKLPERLKDAMDFRNMSFRQASRAIGISHATVHRIATGGVPDVESYLLVKQWLTNEANALVAKAKQIYGACMGDR